MAWGKAPSCDDLITKIRENEDEAMYILPFRKLNEDNFNQIFDELKKNVSLKEFYSSGHKLTSKNVETFSEMLKFCIGQSDFGDEFMSILVSGIESNNTLEILDFENKSITAGSCYKLNHILYTHENIKVIKLNRNPLKTEGIFNLLNSPSQQDNPVSKLQELHVSDIGLDKESSMIFVTVLKNFPDLHVLLLDHNELENSTALLWEYFIINIIISSLSNITILDLSYCKLNENSMPSISCNIFQLQKLNLSYNDIKDEGLLLLSQSIMFFPHLKYLDLSSNNITDSGINYLSESLMNCELNDFRELELKHNQIASKSASKLLKIPYLKEISFFNNNINRYMDGFINAINDSQIEHLDIGVNNITEENIILLLNNLHNHKYLKELEMCGIDRTTDIQIAIDNLKSHNSVITIVWKTKEDKTTNENQL